MEATTPLWIIAAELDRVKQARDAIDPDDVITRSFYRGQIWALQVLRSKIMDVIRNSDPKLGAELDKDFSPRKHA